MRTVVIVLCVLLAAGAVAAGPLFTVTPVEPSDLKDYQGAESFEQAMPPAGWYRDVSNPYATWGLTGAWAFHGNQCAVGNMDIMGDPVDERLGFNTSYSADQTLRFAMRGQTAVNATVLVWVGEDLVFDFARDWTLAWDQWGLVEIDLSQTNYAGHPNVDFAWQYVGTFNPEVYLDMVSIEAAVGSEETDWGGIKRLYR